MNLITKLAYNALTKTIQAIAPGGVSIGVPSLDNVGIQKDLTITNPMGSGSFTVNRAVGFKYRSGNAWRFRFNISVTSSGISNNNYLAAAITGVTFKNGTNNHQAIAAYRYTGYPATSQGAYASINNGQVVFAWSTPSAEVNGQWGFSGDVECESEPTI